ncbi:hypothetical protein [Enterococcus sp. HY326]|uniref:hypothetical protein n=1 Tax=Enterococcus sp. HY326 TaxID=2971265 RepID=UPI00223F554C|nr:hypothetical protein [Enterococcus sp. HY326]
MAKEKITLECRSATTGELLPPDWKFPDEICERLLEISSKIITVDKSDKVANKST